MIILIVSPVRQKPAILREFLESLERLDTEGLFVRYVFTEDNDSPESAQQLKQFKESHSGVYLYEYRTLIGADNPEEFACDDTTHHWSESLVKRVSWFKDYFIWEAICEDVDYLFLVDSDLVLHPATLKHLISLEKDIISEVFWTNFRPDQGILPNCWQSGHYNMDKEFLEQLQKPGTYPVGGLGACTLIGRKALQAGVSFAALPNLDYGGEDRHFCIRAAALGLELWVDTHYPAYHIYRESELAGLPVWRDRQRERGGRITVGMLVHNEADRYLRQVLEQVKQFADSIVILDDASTDETVEVCQGVLMPGGAWLCGNEWTGADGRFIIHCNLGHGFHNEIALRKQLWDLCVTQGNDWIMILDADEIFESRCIEDLPRLAADKDAEVYLFPLYDMWSETHYRSDALWNAHTRFGLYMLRYIPGFDYQWCEIPLHCGRFPINWAGMKVVNSDLRLKHLGWAKQQARLEKYYRYLQQDPDGKYGVMAQYLSIIDEDPHLVEWQEVEKKPTISLCMIVRNEEKNIRRCLDSVKGVFDQTVIVDTGSHDKTVEIAREYNPFIMGCQWGGDFSYVRNVSLERATGDWILYLDADEELTSASRDLLPGLLTNDQVEAYLLTVTSQVGEGERNQDVILRLFRNRPEYRFTGKIHEQIADSIVAVNPGRIVIFMSLLEILHYGYSPEQIAGKDKIARNLEMFEADPLAEGDLLHHYHYGVELMRAERWDDAITELIAASRGINTRQIYFPKLLRYLVMAFYSSGRLDNALDMVRLGIRLVPDYADLYYYGGLICYAQGNYPQAIDCFTKAMECPVQPVNYSSFEGARGEKAKEGIELVRKRMIDLSGVEDYNLLPLYLSAFQTGGPVDITAGDKVFKGITVEGLRREIEWRAGMKVNDKKWWDQQFNNKWELNGGVFQTGFFARQMIDHLNPEILQGEILDYGCALGQAVAALRGRNIIGYDFSDTAIQKARSMYPDLQFTSKLPDKTFDCVLCSNVLEHYEKPVSQLQDILKLSRKYVVIMCPYKTGTDSVHLSEIDDNTFPDVINGFTKTFAQVVTDEGLNYGIWVQILIVYEVMR